MKLKETKPPIRSHKEVVEWDFISGLVADLMAFTAIPCFLCSLEVLEFFLNALRSLPGGHDYPISAQRNYKKFALSFPVNK